MLIKFKSILFSSRRALLFFLFTFFTDADVYSQWQNTNGPFGGRVLSLVTLGSNIFAGSDSTGVYLSTNNGGIWLQTVLNNRTILSLAASGSTIFAGSIGVYISTNNGQNWTYSSVYNRTIYSLAVNNSYVFAGTRYNGVFRSTNNGLNWLQTSLSSQDVYSLAINGSDIFAGTFFQGVYLSTNDGQTWAQTRMSESRIVSSLAVSQNTQNGSSTVFAGCFVGWLDYFGEVDLTTNNGNTWIESLVLSTNSTISALASSDSNIFAGTNRGVYLSSDNGQSWAQWNEGLGNIVVYSLALSSGYIFAGTYNGSVWRRPLSNLVNISINKKFIPGKYNLYQNYPNPFNPMSKIKYDIAKQGIVKLVVFDVLGRELAVLVNEQHKPGSYEAEWDASKYSSGVYFYKISAGDFIKIKKMMLLK